MLTRSLLCTALLVGFAFPAQSQIRVEDALSYSFASGLVASSDGERIAWVENLQGARNVWVADGPAYYWNDDGSPAEAHGFTNGLFAGPIPLPKAQR